MSTDDIRNLLRERGWCQVYDRGHFYNTIGNCRPETIASEERQGWTLVGIFFGDDLTLVNDVSLTPNYTVFRKPSPEFFTEANPWKEKGSFPWLPDLASGTEGEVADHLAKAGGHGSPGIARRFQCACGETAVVPFYHEEEGRAEARCSKCDKLTLVTACSDYAIRRDPSANRLDLEPYACECGSNRVVLDLGIEYPVDASGGWDFSWITLAATCVKCRKAVQLLEAETA